MRRRISFRFFVNLSVILLFGCLTSQKAVTSYEFGVANQQSDTVRINAYLKETNEQLKARVNVSVFVLVNGKRELLPVTDFSNSPTDINYTFNVVKNNKGEVILLKEIPYIESGDWSVDFSMYFQRNKIVAFVRAVAYLDETCSESVIRDKTVNYYDENFSLIGSVRTVTGLSGSLGVDCQSPHSIQYEIPKTF